MPAARLRRHRRLLALCALSALLHGLVLRWIAAHAPAPATPRAPLADGLVLRLAPAGPAAPAPADAPHAADPRMPTAAPARAADAVPAPDAVASATRAPAQQQQQQQAIPLDTGDTAAPAGASAGAIPDGSLPDGSLPAGALPAGGAGASGPADQADPAGPVPGRYRVRMPPPVLLTYARTRQAPAMPDRRLADARIDWRSDGRRYALSVDGVLGRLDSSGASGDAGMLPRRAVERRDGRELVTQFTEDGRVLLPGNGAGAADSLGVLDRATLPLQLAAIGLGEPDQIEHALGRPIEVVVAGTDAVTRMRFEVAGLESVATALGALPAWRLVQQAAPGQARLEVWLAPERGWLPVQLRVTQGGVADTQTLQMLQMLQVPAAPAGDAPGGAAASDAAAGAAGAADRNAQEPVPVDRARRRY